MRHIPSVLLVGNTKADKQESMLRYADLLSSLYSEFCFVRRVESPCFFGRFPGLSAGLRKYLGYIDKLIIFPIFLLIVSHRYHRVHIVDHGNAYYSFCCPRLNCIITCHDLLAVRAAFGDSSTACLSSPMGVWLQRLILSGLRRAGTVVFVSESTRLDYQRLVGKLSTQRQHVIPNPLNAPFRPDPLAFPLTPAEHALFPEGPYLLMVGSSLPRKNRYIALQILEKLGASSAYRVVFAGAPLTPAEEGFRMRHQFGNRLISIERPSHALLNCLYCHAHALLFPSFAEGFGWPLLEAQACHCPVIASRTTSIPEVAGAGALYADPTSAEDFIAHVRILEIPAERSKLITLGSANVKRFSQSEVAYAYRYKALQL